MAKLNLIFFPRSASMPAGGAGSTLSGARLARGSLLAFLLGFGSGCYSFPAVAGVPAPGTRVVLELNDQGRVSMSEAVGPSATLIEGVLQPGVDSAFPLRVMSVDYLNGQTNKWNGEQLTVSRNFVRVVKERQFSRSRTFLFASAVGGAALAFILTRGIIGHGSPDTDTPIPKPPES